MTVAALLLVITIITLAPGPVRSQPGWYVAALLVILATALSYVVHELAHRIVAGRLRVSIAASYPDLFGGLPDDALPPTDPRSDALIALSGPFASILVATIAGSVWIVGDGTSLAAGAVGVVALVNLALAVANLLPGFPLDGGRVFRAFMWYLTDDLIVATRWAATYGNMIAIAGIVSGLFLFSLGRDLSVWGSWAILGFWTINRAGAEGFQRTLWRESLKDLTVFDAGLSNSRRVSAARTIDDALDDLLASNHEGPLLVEAETGVIGFVSLDQIRRVPRVIWTVRTIADVVAPLGEHPPIQHDTPANELLDLLRAHPDSVVLVETRGRITGAIDQQSATRRLRAHVRETRSIRRRFRR